MTEDEQYDLDASMEHLSDDRHKRCPTCGASENKFTTTVVGDGEDFEKHLKEYKERRKLKCKKK
jgi:hypothetical protein